MSWYRDDDGKIITDEEFQDDCCECSCFCQEGTISVPCNGERSDCPHFKEVDTSEYDKEIRNQVITEFAERIEKRIKEEVALLENERNEAREYEDEQIIFATNNQLRAFDYSLRVIAEEMRGAT